MMGGEIRPCEDAKQLQQYINTYWRRGHVLATDDAMLRFTYSTSWVDKSVWTGGLSVLGLYDGTRMTGFLGSIVTPYPRSQSYWLALWHVLPETKGTGLGGKLLARMQSIAEESDGWIGTFGAGPEALPVYLKRGYCVRAARRWVYSPEHARMDVAPMVMPVRLHSAEQLPSEGWFDHRYWNHPLFTYQKLGEVVYRTEENSWGMVTHICHHPEDAERTFAEIFATESGKAKGRRYLMDAWGFECPGDKWIPAPEDLPSVFHPPEARGSTIYSVGRPFVVTRVFKGDCDQDRPNGVVNESEQTAAVHHH